MNEEPLITVSDVLKAFLILLGAGVLVAISGLFISLRSLLPEPGDPDEKFKYQARVWLRTHAPDFKLAALIRPMRAHGIKVSLAQVRKTNDSGQEVTKSYLFKVGDGGNILASREVDGEAQKKELAIEIIPSTTAQVLSVK